MQSPYDQDIETSAIEAHRALGYHQTMLNLSGKNHPHQSMIDRYEVSLQRLQNQPGYPPQEECDYAQSYGETMAQKEWRQQSQRPAFGRG